MRKLVDTPSFRRAYRKQVKRNRTLQPHIDETLRKMQEDLFSPALGTHKLSGKLLGLWASACGYDCRIVFSLDMDPTDEQEVILLIDIGTHDEVY
jgi:mRNA-degrading endonuclease YafQ of YafQ-DinJ toxin-antitoxin module